jgi:hypothetical protein
MIADAFRWVVLAHARSFGRLESIGPPYLKCPGVFDAHAVSRMYGNYQWRK